MLYAIQVRPNETLPDSVLTQLIWREFFYVMSVNNPLYGVMRENPICLDIEWYDNEEQLRQWEKANVHYFPNLRNSLRCEVSASILRKLGSVIIY